jgi:hypothetical protein
MTDISRDVHQIKNKTLATFLLIFSQLRGPATALSRNLLHDLTTARYFKGFL